MLNTDFDPLALLLHLQNIQQQQAENMVKVSEWMMEVSETVKLQEDKLNRSLSLISALNKQLLLHDERIKLLEKHLIDSINNTSSKDTVPTWDL